MKNRLNTRLAFAVALALAAGMVHAQTSPTTTASPVDAPQAVGLVPAEVSTPVEATQVQTPATVIENQGASSFSSMSLVDEDMGNDDLVRDVARLRTREGRVEAMSDLEKAQLEREKGLIQARLDLLELRNLLANDGKAPSETPAQAAPGAPGAASAPVAVYQPQPVVRSIYGHGDNSFAEIYIGSAKIVATKGTVLATGERVVDISPAGVVVVKRGRRQVLQVAGSAGIQPASVAAPGLPPRP